MKNQLLKRFFIKMKLPVLATFLSNCFSPLGLTITSLMLFSSSALAIGDLIKSQTVAQINTTIYIAAGGTGGLLLLMVIVSLLKSRRISKLQKAKDISDVQLDTLPVGLLHVSLDNKILYANPNASQLLGRLNDKLLNQDISDCFFSQHANDIANAMRQNHSQIAAKARASNLFLSLNFGEVSDNGKHQYKVLCLTDENQLKRSLVASSEQLSELQHMSQAMSLANIWIDVNENTYCFDKRLADLIGLTHNNQQKAPLQELTDRIHHADTSVWSKAIQSAKNQGKENHHSQATGQAPIICRMLINSKSKTKQYVSLRLSFVAKLDENAQCILLHIGIQDNSQGEHHKQSLDLKIQEQQALLNASNHPIYGLDESGNILWSNSAFNMLFRHIVPNAPSKNLFALDFFPEEVKKLHMSSPSLSGRSYNMDFSLPDPVNDANAVKHYKMGLSFYSSKNRLGEKSIKGMVGILQDTSEIQAAKADALQQQQQLANMLNLAPVAIATIDANDRIISANSVMSRRLGFSDSELKRQDFYQLFNEPSAAGKAAKKLHQTGHLRDFHAELKGKDNKLHPSELHVDIISKEKQEYLCWISDRSDEQFQQDKFDSLLEHSSMPMAILGENGFSKLNNEACKFFCVQNDFDLFGVSPYSMRLNTDEDTASALQQIVGEVKASGKARAFTWTHQVGDLQLPCQATYVPLYKDQYFESILCIWMDKRELQKADEARQLAINLHQAAEREIAEKQELLATSQDQLANKMRTLADTEQQLQCVQEDLNDTQSEYQYLQQEHQHVTNNLLELKSQYGESREQLLDAQKTNAELHDQLESSNQELIGLNAQRSELDQALKRSEENYKAAQKQLAISEENTQALQAQQSVQQEKMHALVDQISNMKRSVSDKDAQINQVSEQITALQTQLNSSSSTTEKLRKQLVCQREASEKAEQERRKIEHTCQLAQAELRNKERHFDHLQSEMGKLEEMSNQEKGDMQAQQWALKQELDDKLSQLQTTQQALEAAQQAAEHEKNEKTTQQQLLAKVQKELLEVEQAAQEKQSALAQKEKEQRQAQQQLQQKLWSELKAKQLKLQETEQVLQQAKQQTESEKAQKDKHRQLYEQLQAELQDIETRNQAQQEKMAQSDKQWHDSKEMLKQEVTAKRDQLEQTKKALDEIQQTADKERLARIEQEQKLEQLTRELSDVETRANKQKEMLAGSDEQWRKHHDEIELQKQQLQQALQSAQAQNESLQSRLSTKLHDLQAAESQVSQTQSGEQAAQKELDTARTKAQALYLKIRQQEEKEIDLQQQLQAQQQALETKESSISHLQDKQKTLTEELAAVQREYAQSKETLTAQHHSHSNLNTQMNDLEGALSQSKQALVDKESDLQSAQLALEESQALLAQQENALLNAHKQELQQATEQLSTTDSRNPEIEALPMPDKPTVWFDLLPYLQSQPNIESLPIALTKLMNDLQATIQTTEKALDENDKRTLINSSKVLVTLSENVNSDALAYLMASIQSDCTNGMVDNVSIRWPATKQGLQKTLRVVYSHLHA
jgi:epidermal growth factor receptor substrate 15